MQVQQRRNGHAAHGGCQILLCFVVYHGKSFPRLQFRRNLMFCRVFIILRDISIFLKQCLSSYPILNKGFSCIRRKEIKV